MRRVTSIVSASLNAAGARRSELSRTRPTSAMLREGRLPEPEKITSSMPDARMLLYELSPMTQRRASTRLDLPQPFGPTTPVNPGSIRKSVASQKLLKPARRSRSNFMGLALSHPFPCAGAQSRRPDGRHSRHAAINAARDQGPKPRKLCETALFQQRLPALCRSRTSRARRSIFCPLTKNVGVESMANRSAARSRVWLT